MNPDQLRPIVQDVLKSILSKAPQTSEKTTSQNSSGGSGAALVSAKDVLAARSQGHLVVAKGAIITPLARDTAERFGVSFVAPGETPKSSAAQTGGASPEPLSRSPSPMESGGVLAIGSDHGGFKLKNRLVAWLKERQRFEVVDHGSHDGQSCDYPDIACSVARSVALGEAQWGVLIDGAGIGSCMAANKVPGVLAANCHSPATARNSREHNGANVLCLGSGHLDADAAFEVLEAWLSMPFGGGRHGRRVAKIKDIEQAFVRRP